ncbi:hypothetical protein ES705_13477 [subsurface metagenome]|nr:MAG: hypothetical protein ES695_04340 [Candidatus Atribacteria bacterium 1244-E10-H5-B2]
MDSCYLCGSSDVKFIGSCAAKQNDDSVDWLMGKVKAGKTRVFCFRLCENCFDLPNKEKLIEEKIESDLKLQTGYSVKVKE